MFSKNLSDEKPQKFNGIDFKRWQQKMIFYLTTMNLAHIVKEEVPKADGDPPSKESLMTIEEVWEMLEKKYKTEDVGAKKFVIGKFLKFIMVDSKTVVKQVEEFTNKLGPLLISWRGLDLKRRRPQYKGLMMMMMMKIKEFDDIKEKDDMLLEKLNAID
ncbi:hypothetical protein FEM48_Zijuj03G0186700 [Ziziphus jujuba var. spinosa]|uniref:Uncharacterized protein n=1 Tax=Ziziphus jujuba var. spinosa TaxID=714518 RepID=A0A978VRZ1_ZIZJJ|nr:hypothetical protein FEM48_Zijuj03G0186700 [Ziziphus jujuba var. spinosa]